jgi:hypothetical protein
MCKGMTYVNPTPKGVSDDNYHPPKAMWAPDPT